VDHEEAGGVVRPRGQTAVAAAIVTVVVVGAFLVDRIGVHAAPPAPAPTTASGAWFCPHGGGPHWSTTVTIANPGPTPVTVRATALSSDRPRDLGTMAIPPGASRTIEAPSADRESSTAIEYFDGWVAAGWVARAGGGDVGVAAEPCLSGAGTRWTLPDGDTEKGESAYVVVMNPFASDAVFDVTALSDSGGEKGLTDFSDYVLASGQSAAFKLNQIILGSAAVAGRVDVSIGRVAVAALGISAKDGVRSADGWLGAPPHRTVLPGGGDSGASVLLAANPGQSPSTFSGSQFGEKGISTAGRLQQQAADGGAAAAYPVTTGGAAGIAISSAESEPGVVVARRTHGSSHDLGSTGGVPSASDRWVVMPATGSAPRTPMIYLTNPGRRTVDVSLSTIPASGDPRRATAVVPPGRTVSAPKRLFEAPGDAPVMASSGAGSFVPVAASYSGGEHGVAGYAVSAGVVVPAGG
jgi:Family of unknown function (DUF5719)